MNTKTLDVLEYEKVKIKVSEFAMSYLGKMRIRGWFPMTDRRQIRVALDECMEGCKVLEQGGSIPIPALEGMESVMMKFCKGFILTVTELEAISNLLEQSIRLKRFMSNRQTIAPTISQYAHSICELPQVKEELSRCLRHGHITDQASHELAKVRKQIIVTEDRLKKKLDQALKKYRSYLQDQLVTTRQNRYVLPVKKEHRKLVPGTVLDESTSGQTVFVEPYDISGLTQELTELTFSEAREEDAVLYRLTEQVEQYQHELTILLETLGEYDFLFAKAKYAVSIQGRNVELNEQGYIAIHSGKHPLLECAVPLDVTIGQTYQALLITGPNTGGKTVCLKTVGLLTLLVQSGLLPPVAEGSIFSVFTNIVLDIGDGQSLEHSLSTFSAHITNVIDILKVVNESTLVLLDELASGTDPGEGVGLSIAVLEELHRRGATLLATTHFDEIKRYAEVTQGFQVARMAFDVETLSPLYRLQIGEAGESYAFYIALRLGLPSYIVERSKEIATKDLDQKVKGVFKKTEERLEPNAHRTNQRSNDRGDTIGNHMKQKKPEFQIGDCVWIHTLRRTGIVRSLPDPRGNIIVQIQKETCKINRKRLSLYVERAQLYPNDYDMRIVFDTKENRKKHRILERKHVDGTYVEWNDTEQESK